MTNYYIKNEKILFFKIVICTNNNNYKNDI